jgi:hypothetical protein
MRTHPARRRHKQARLTETLALTDEPAQDLSAVPERGELRDETATLGAAPAHRPSGVYSIRGHRLALVESWW